VADAEDRVEKSSFLLKARQRENESLRRLFDEIEQQAGPRNTQDGGEPREVGPGKGSASDGTRLHVTDRVSLVGYQSGRVAELQALLEAAHQQIAEMQKQAEGLTSPDLLSKARGRVRRETSRAEWMTVLKGYLVSRGRRRSWRKRCRAWRWREISWPAGCRRPRTSWPGGTGRMPGESSTRAPPG
jgi:hypothetical protein